MITGPSLSGKKIGVFGLARSGLSAIDALVASGATVFADDDDAARVSDLGKTQPGIQGGLDETTLRGLDALMLAPGVPLTFPRPHRVVMQAKAANVPLIADFDLFEACRDVLPKHRIVAITGTNGKSTTTALIAHVLDQCGIPSAMGGNIGTGVMALDPLPEGGVYVLELSSFQLDLIRDFRPDVAIVLNIAPDHLDRHGSMEAYVAAKRGIFSLNPESAAIIGVDDPWCQDIADGLGRRGHRISAAGNKADTSVGAADLSYPALRGEHNAQNCAAALACARYLGLDDAAIWSAMASFPGLEHRQELVAGDPSVTFVNDSKATNIDAARRALLTFDRIFWLAGGINADGDALRLGDSDLNNVSECYFYGRDRELLEAMIAGRKPVQTVDTLENAFDLAYAKAQSSGATLLLSPACKAFDLFRDFESRGDTFKDLVATTMNDRTPANEADATEYSPRDGGGHL